MTNTNVAQTNPNQPNDAQGLPARYFIRRATEADIPLMRPFWQEANEMLAVNDPLHSLAPDAGEHWERMARHWLTGEGAVVVFVAESTLTPGRVLGYIVGTLAENQPTHAMTRYGVVLDMAVDFHARMGGLGAAMLAAFKGWLREKDVTHLQADVPIRHPMAQAFWRALGAVPRYEQMWLKVD